MGVVQREHHRQWGWFGVSITRGLLATLALGTALLASVLVVTGTNLPVDVLVSALGNDYFVLALLGGVAVVGAASVQVRRRIGGIDQATPPDTEDVHIVPTLGSDLDDYLAAPLGVGESEPPGTRTRLFRLAVTVVMREDGCPRVEAERRVENGTWTTDPCAATYLARGEAGSVSSSQRLRAALRGDSATQHGVRRAATEIVHRDSGVTSP